MPIIRFSASGERQVRVNTCVPEKKMPRPSPHRIREEALRTLVAAFGTRGTVVTRIIVPYYVTSLTVVPFYFDRAPSEELAFSCTSRGQTEKASHPSTQPSSLAPPPKSCSIVKKKLPSACFPASTPLLLPQPPPRSRDKPPPQLIKTSPSPAQTPGSFFSRPLKRHRAFTPPS